MGSDEPVGLAQVSRLPRWGVAQFGRGGRPDRSRAKSTWAKLAQTRG